MLFDFYISDVRRRHEFHFKQKICKVFYIGLFCHGLSHPIATSDPNVYIVKNLHTKLILAVGDYDDYRYVFVLQTRTVSV